MVEQVPPVVTAPSIEQRVTQLKDYVDKLKSLAAIQECQEVLQEILEKTAGDTAFDVITKGLIDADVLRVDVLKSLTNPGAADDPNANSVPPSTTTTASVEKGTSSSPAKGGEGDQEGPNKRQKRTKIPVDFVRSDPGTEKTNGRRRKHYALTPTDIVSIDEWKKKHGTTRFIWDQVLEEIPHLKDRMTRAQLAAAYHNYMAVALRKTQAGVL